MADKNGDNFGGKVPTDNAEQSKNLQTLSQLDAMEFILSYIFPRSDRKVIAKNLIEKFGNIQRVLEASESSLMEVNGMNERATIMLSGLIKIFDYYTNCKAKATRIESWSDIYDYCEKLVRFLNRETMYIIGLNAEFKVVAHQKLGTGNALTVSASGSEVVSFLNSTRAANVVFTHNHPGGSCTPSHGDDTSTERFKEMVEAMHSKFLDHVIVGSDGIYSLEYKKKVRTFFTTETVKELAKYYTDEDK